MCAVFLPKEAGLRPKFQGFYWGPLMQARQSAFCRCQPFQVGPPKRVFLPSIINQSQQDETEFGSEAKESFIYSKNGKKPAHAPASNSLPQPGAGLLWVLVGEGEWSTHQAAPLCPSGLSAGCTFCGGLQSKGPRKSPTQLSNLETQTHLVTKQQTTSKVAIEFFGLSVSSVQSLPQMHMHTVVFSPTQFLCILLLREKCVQVQTLQHCSKGSQVPAHFITF